MTEDDLFEDVRHWKGRADAAEAEMCEARELGGKYLREMVAQKNRADDAEARLAIAVEALCKISDLAAEKEAQFRALLIRLGD